MSVIVYDLKSQTAKPTIKPEPRYNLRPRKTPPNASTSSTRVPPDTGCIICLDTSTEGGQKVWSPCCRRSFHSVCLMSWCGENETALCPLCRKEIPKVKVLLRIKPDGGDEFVTETFGYVIE